MMPLSIKGDDVWTNAQNLDGRFGAFQVSMGLFRLVSRNTLSHIRPDSTLLAQVKGTERVSGKSK